MNKKAKKYQTTLPDNIARALARMHLGKSSKETEAQKKIDSATYDGVMGCLPDWVPEPLQTMFVNVRNKLLGRYTHDELLVLIESREILFSEPRLGWSSLEFNRDDGDIDKLVYIQKIVELGEEQGIKSYLGESGSKSIQRNIARDKQKNAARQPRADGLQKAILAYVKQNIDITQKELIRKLANDPCVIEITDYAICWQASENSPIHESPLSGLKDRLSRAKKSIRANRL